MSQPAAPEGRGGARAVAVAALTVGVPWSFLEVAAFARRTRLVFDAGDVPALLATDLALCTAAALAGAAAGAGIGRVFRRPEAGGMAVAGALGAATGVFLLSVLLSQPIPGRDTHVVPGGTPVAVAISAGLPLAGLALALAVGPGRALLGGWALALAAALLVYPARPPRFQAGEAAADAPNVLLVTIDTLRADHVATIGGGPPDVRTPNMDRLASEGVLFSQAFSQVPITGPSHTSMLSGLYPWTHETLINGVALKPGIPNLPERLAGGGYRTGAFVSAYVLDGDFGYGQGFDTYDDEFYAVKGLYDTSPMRLWYQLRIRLWLVDDIERRGDRTTDEALRWLDRNGDQPFMAWVHLYDPHGNYIPPPPYDTMYYSGDPRDPGKKSMPPKEKLALYSQEHLDGITDADWVLAQYKGEVTFTDHQVGRLLQKLDDLGVRERTIVYLVADHGESLTEHDYWFNHGALLYDPDLHVPMMVRWPGKIPAGMRVDALAEVTDVTPTLLDLLGVPPWEMKGRSLKPLWEGTRPPVPETDSMCFDREANRQGGMWRFKMVSTRTGTSRYVCRQQGKDELYDLTTDPEETVNLAGDPERAALVAAFEQHCQAVLDSTGKGADDRANESLTMTPEQCEKLKALGYVDNDTDCGALGPPGSAAAGSR